MGGIAALAWGLPHEFASIIASHHRDPPPDEFEPLKVSGERLKQSAGMRSSKASGTLSAAQAAAYDFWIYDADVILFDGELSPRHQRELEKALGENVRAIHRVSEEQ